MQVSERYQICSGYLVAAPVAPTGDEQRQWQGQGEQGAEGPLYFEQAVAEVSYEQ